VASPSSRATRLACRFASPTGLTEKVTRRSVKIRILLVVLADSRPGSSKRPGTQWPSSSRRLRSVSQWRRSASAFSRTHPVRAFVVARVSRRRSALISQSRPRAAACAFRVRKCRVADETCTGGTSFFPSAGWQALAAPANRGIELSRLAPDSPPIPCRAHARSRSGPSDPHSSPQARPARPPRCARRRPCHHR